MKDNKILVVDSSVAFKWISIKDESLVEKADLILERFKNNKVHIVMPELAKYEIANALVYKDLRIDLGKGVLAMFHAIPIEFIPQNLEMAQISFTIAKIYKLSFYDASFIALAATQKADLITDNQKHQAKYKGKDVKIIPLKDYK